MKTLKIEFKCTSEQLEMIEIAARNHNSISDWAKQVLTVFAITSFAIPSSKVEYHNEPDNGIGT